MIRDARRLFSSAGEKDVARAITQLQALAQPRAEEATARA